MYSESVCDHTAWIASLTGASITLVHVLGRRDVSSEPTNLSGSIGLGARSELLEELADLDAQKARLGQKRGRAILEDGKARIEAMGATDVRTRLRHGEMVETVQELEPDARLIVIGKRGEAADFDKGHLGSNLERVVRSTNKLVFVASRKFQPIERVLVAFDGGASALQAVEFMARSPVFEGLAIHLLAAGDARTTLAHDLEGASALLNSAGRNTSHEIVAGQPESVIASKVATENYDLLLMGAYGHSRIRSLIIGSTTTQMLRACKIPVLLFR